VGVVKLAWRRVTALFTRASIDRDIDTELRLHVDLLAEEYERGGDTTHAVAEALESTGRLITGAAAIMAAVFFGFATARSVIIQAVGIGIGLAVVIDATIVRALLVPATMRLMGRWNWWAPGPLASLHRRLGLAERSSNAEVVPR